MSNDKIKEHIFCLWIIAAILIFVADMHNQAFVNLTERVDALEQSGTSETKR